MKKILAIIMLILCLSSNFTVHADEIRVNKLNGSDPNKADLLFNEDSLTKEQELKIGSTADKASGPVNSTFYIEAVEATTITLSKVGSPTVGTAKYGINNTSPSTDYTYGDSINLSAGQKCYWTITSTTTGFDYSNYLNFTSTGKINAGGNLSSLIGGSTVIPRDGCFINLFRDCTKLVDASAIRIASITSNSKWDVFGAMFSGCSSLKTAPQLPFTTMVGDDYFYMFENCTSLTVAPDLPATTLAYCCYNHMFVGCTSLTEAPVLPVAVLAENCYRGMFESCTSLKTPPALPATNLAVGCYAYMFEYSGLESLPVLPATELKNECYREMFYGTKVKLSTSRTGEYTIAYRIPNSGTGTNATDALIGIFTNTAGASFDYWNGASINTTYYVPVSLKYEITIPSSVNLNSSTLIPVTYNVSGGSINMAITSANNWKLKSGSNNLSYSLNKTSWTIAEGSGTDNLTVSVSGIPSVTGSYSDILTFTYGE